MSVQTVRRLTELSCVVYFPSKNGATRTEYATVYSYWDHSTFVVGFSSGRPLHYLSYCLKQIMAKFTHGSVTGCKQPHGRCRYVMFRSTEQYSWPMTDNYDLRNLPNYALPIRVKRNEPPACPRHDFTSMQLHSPDPANPIH